MDDAGTRRDSLFEHAHQITGIIYWYGKVQLLEHDLFPARTLLPCGDHPRIVLAGRQHFVAGFEVQAKLCDLQRFTGVPRDSNAFGIGAPHTREAFPYVFDPRFQVVPHAVSRELVAITDRFDLGIQDRGPRRRDPAIVQVKDLWIAAIRAADLLPKIFVPGYIFRGDMRIGAVHDSSQY